MKAYRRKSNHWIWKELDRLLNHPYRFTENYEPRIDRLKAVLRNRRRNRVTIWRRG